MEYYKLMSIFTITLILHSCFLLGDSEIDKKKLLGVWYLESYERVNSSGSLITANCPFDVYPYIVEEYDEYYYIEGVYPESLIYEYYILIDDTDVHGYYKLNYTNIDPEIYGYNDNFTGLYYDIYNVDSYSIDSEGIISTSREYINGMSIEIDGDSLTLNGIGKITFRRVQESDLIGATIITEQQSGHFLLMAYVALDNLFESSETFVEAEIPGFSNIPYRDMVRVPGGTFNQVVTPFEYFDDEMNSGDGIYVPSYEFQHTISEYQIGKYEVTYELWYAVYTWAVNNGFIFYNVGREGSERGYIPYGGYY